MVLKQRRTNCKMTQEFIAETLSGSRQPVTKWKSGASDNDSTSYTDLLFMDRSVTLSDFPASALKMPDEQLSANLVESDNPFLTTI
ncbi:hypothetical protein [uncultured Gemmiger sp.]|uniref:hypothetical protein n=1 Tax=uncultured Gemmiger sp. TaxID=1623490 RepID=UPI002594CC26|nr:hypothetical protein [uncultured Gemmiger sp.]